MFYELPAVAATRAGSRTNHTRPPRARCRASTSSLGAGRRTSEPVRPGRRQDVARGHHLHPGTLRRHARSNPRSVPIALQGKTQMRRLKLLD